MTHQFQPGDVVRLDFKWPHEKEKDDRALRLSARNKGRGAPESADSLRTGGIKQRYAIILSTKKNGFFAVPITSNPPDAADADYTHVLTGAMKGIIGLDNDRESYVKTHVVNFVEMPNSAITPWARHARDGRAFAPVRMPGHLVETLSMLNKRAISADRVTPIPIRTDVFAADRQGMRLDSQSTPRTPQGATSSDGRPAGHAVAEGRRDPGGEITEPGRARSGNRAPDTDEEPRYLPGDPRGRAALEARLHAGVARKTHGAPTHAKSRPTLTVRRPAAPPRKAGNDDLER